MLDCWSDPELDDLLLLLGELSLEPLQLIAERQPLLLQHVQDRVVLLPDRLACD